MTAITLCLGAGVALGGCSGSSSSTPTSIAGSDIAKKGASQFSKQFKAKFTMTCPHDLKAKVGATTRCVTTNPAGAKIGTTVSVTSVKGGHVEFHFQNDNHLLK